MSNIRIYSQEDFQKMKVAGHLTATILNKLDDFIKVGTTTQEIDDFCAEASYWLSCYYESGHCRNEGEEFKDRKAFIKFLDVFKPFCKEKHTKWIPYNEETKFLFD